MEVQDTPFRVTSEDGVIIVDGPAGAVMTLTTRAAIQSCHRMLEQVLRIQDGDNQQHVN